MFTDKMVFNAPLNESVVNAETGKVDFTKSTGGIRPLVEREQQLNAALAAAKAVGTKVVELEGVYNNFSQEDLDRLNELLPDNVDNIQLIIDVNGIAKKNGMTLKNVKVTTETEAGKPIAAANPKLGSMVLSFSVRGSYADYKKFIVDLASSLRIIDISSISFSSDDKGVYDYQVSLKTYWQKII